jgi:hypothetical protein
MGGGNIGGAGVVAKIIRKGSAFAAHVVTVVGIYSCTNVRDSEMSTALSKALATKTLFKLESVRTDLHQQEETCLAHGAEISLSTARRREEQSHPGKAALLTRTVVVKVAND